MNAKQMLAQKLAQQKKKYDEEHRWSTIFAKLLAFWLFVVASAFAFFAQEVPYGVWVTLLAAGVGVCVSIALLLSARKDDKDREH